MPLGLLIKILLAKKYLKQTDTPQQNSPGLNSKPSKGLRRNRQ